MPDFEKFLKEERDKLVNSEIPSSEQDAPSFPNRILDRVKKRTLVDDNENGIARFGGALRSPHFEYAFLESARTLFDAAKAESYLDELGTVILYLIRHSLELLLKELILTSHRLCLNRNKKQEEVDPTGHRLKELCGKLTVLLKTIDRDEGWEDEESLAKKIQPLRKLVEEFNKLDPEGDKFRYPTNRKKEHLLREIFTENGLKVQKVPVLKREPNFPKSIGFPLEDWLTRCEEIFEKLAIKNFCSEVYPPTVEPTTLINTIYHLSLWDYYEENNDAQVEYERSENRRRSVNSVLDGLKRISNTADEQDRKVVDTALELLNAVDLNKYINS